ncbi:hypothetical protein [Pseudonocardia sp. N23]|uniref:hypothetical protein n=1 Tax=Pseudonocardia sp. N23 TaxID=1987376 RepID=UPI000BFDB618|nr:hypothetical protein [Pseudonocardia sp. N23]
MTRAAGLATVAQTALPRPQRLACDRCARTGWLTHRDGEQLCVVCAGGLLPQEVPPARPKPVIPAPAPTAIACGCCDEVVALTDLRWRNRRALLLGCRFCTPKEDQ